MCDFSHKGNFFKIDLSKKDNVRLSKRILDTREDLKHGDSMECDLDYQTKRYEKLNIFLFVQIKSQKKSKKFQNIWWIFNHQNKNTVKNSEKIEVNEKIKRMFITKERFGIFS